MCTHLRVLGESYPMNTNMTGFRCFSEIRNFCRYEWVNIWPEGNGCGTTLGVIRGQSWNIRLAHSVWNLHYSTVIHSFSVLICMPFVQFLGIPIGGDSYVIILDQLLVYGTMLSNSHLFSALICMPFVQFLGIPIGGGSYVIILDQLLVYGIMLSNSHLFSMQNQMVCPLCSSWRSQQVGAVMS